MSEKASALTEEELETLSYNGLIQMKDALKHTLENIEGIVLGDRETFCNNLDFVCFYSGLEEGKTFQESEDVKVCSVLDYCRAMLFFYERSLDLIDDLYASLFFEKVGEEMKLIVGGDYVQ